jgi:hypothetical protein
MTCDHNCVIITGLISARVRSVCNAVTNDVTSRGEGVGGESENIECKGVVDGEVRARKVCLRDEKAFGEAVAGWMDGDGGRICWLGDDGAPLRKGVELANTVLLLFFFLLPNGRRKDQSDSN